MKNIEKVMNEFSRDITDHYTLVVKDPSGVKRFTFKDHKVRALENELKKHYGDKVVKKMCYKIRQAETRGTLKNFAVDDSVDFIIDGDGKLKTLFKEEMNEVSAEIAKGKQGLGYVPRKIFDAQGKQVTWDKLGPEWQKTLQEVVGVLNKNPKIAAKFAPDTGEVDLAPGPKNIISLTADDGTKYTYNIMTKRLEG